MMPVKRLSLTDLKTKIPRAAREKTLRKALEADGSISKWGETAWAKKLKIQKVRSEMSDFDRFKLYKAKKNRSKLVKTALKPKKSKK